MSGKLYVGNLAYSVSTNDLEQLFSQVGKVQSVTVIVDKFSGQSERLRLLGKPIKPAGTSGRAPYGLRHAWCALALHLLTPDEQDDFRGSTADAQERREG